MVRSISSTQFCNPEFKMGVGVCVCVCVDGVYRREYTGSLKEFLMRVPICLFFFPPSISVLPLSCLSLSFSLTICHWSSVGKSCLLVGRLDETKAGHVCPPRGRQSTQSQGGAHSSLCEYKTMKEFWRLVETTIVLYTRAVLMQCCPPSCKSVLRASLYNTER